MTRQPVFSDLAGIVADLSQSFPQEVRYQRLLDALIKNFPCDAIALLEREESVLIPRATRGLSQDTMGRRFVIQNHPRLAQIMDSRKPVRFAADSELPDPYDGLIESVNDHLYVHDCMGAALYIDDIPWGIVTMDSLNPNAFDDIDLSILQAFLDVSAATVRAASWIQRLEEQLERHQKIISSQATRSGPTEIIGESREMLQLLNEAKIVSASDLPVLILGETGVGKELIANYIHHFSSRSAEPMIYINCAALPETIAESELFGHIKGAFTGATDNRMGKFELAHEGTLFLDEVGELPLSIQAKLLRTLQNGEIQRLGSDDDLHVDVRIIAATNRDLKQGILEGKFRADLYHRLSVYPIVVPALRDRPNDILPLAGFFLERDARRMGVRGVRMTLKAKSWLKSLEWPGNIRELEHTLSRATIRALSEGQDPGRIIEIDLSHLEGDGSSLIRSKSKSKTKEIPGSIEELSLKDIVEDYKRQVIEKRLERFNGNKSATARSLGIDRANFVRQLNRLGVES